MSEKNTNVTETVEIDPGMSVMPEGPGLMDVPTVIPELDSVLAAMPTALPAYQTTAWKNKPSTETPVDAAVMTRVEQRLVDLTNAVNGLRDSVSHIDPGVHIRTSPLGPGQTLHINGSEWQTYLLFGSSSICTLIEHRGAGEPTVNKLSGTSITVKKGLDTSIDVSVVGMNGTITVFSFRDFTLTRG